MANEIVWEHDTTAVVLYFVVSKPSDATRWNGSAFATHADANWTTYAVAMAEQGTASRTYIGSFPTGITTAGRYRVTIYLRATGTALIGDTKLGSGSIDWTGTAEDVTGFDTVFVESGISASAALLNDATTQLTAINARQALAVILSACGGTLAGGGTTSVTIKPAGLSTPTRITATVDGSGNRTPTIIKVPT